MKKDKKHINSLQTRREFFKKAAKTVLPILGSIMLASAPTIVKAKESAPQWCRYGCAGFCAGQCYASCMGGCYGSCVGCVGFCKVQCIGCTGSCQGTCINSCALSCSVCE